MPLVNLTCKSGCQGRRLNDPVFYHCVGRDQGGELLLSYLNYPVLYHCVGRDQGGELLLRYLNYPVFYLCVGRDQGGELQGVPRDEPED